MRAATCFSGIGAPECAMPEWEWLWSADIEPFPNTVRAARFPQVASLGDVMADDFLQRALSHGPLDVLVGGPPCQDFSVAGLRAGIDGARGNLSLRWVQIIHAVRPRWTVTENVPGWLSVNGGHAFGAFLAGLVGNDTALVPPEGCGGRWTDAGMVAGPAGRAAWRILDAQYFGVPQQRQRVFVISSFGAGRDPASVLFEPHCFSGRSPPRPAEVVSVCLTRRGPGSLDDRETYIVEGDHPRHMTPIEHERAFGFPDNHTAVMYRGKPATDRPRYKALGNSMAVPVLAWIGRRINAVEALA